MTRLSRTLLMAFAALGLGAASASSYVHYRLLTDPAYSSFCDVSASVNCTQAYLSQYGSFWGVPVALFGVFFFALVVLLAGMGGRPSSSVRDGIPAYIFAISTVALAFILYLGWASYVQLKTFCVLCAITYVSVIAIFIVSGGASTFPMTTLPRRVPRDVRTRVGNPLDSCHHLLAEPRRAGAAVRLSREPPHVDNLQRGTEPSGLSGRPPNGRRGFRRVVKPHDHRLAHRHLLRRHRAVR